MKLILASESSIRKKILRDARIPFRCLIGAGEEPSPKDGERAEDYVLRAAEAKALNCWDSHNESAKLSGEIILGCDQVVRFRGQILRKVQSLDKAIERLLAFSEEKHELVNGLVAVENGQVTVRRHEVVRLKVRSLDRSQVKKYIEREKPLSSVACYFLEGEGIKLIDSFEGNFFTALGLPVLAVSDLLLSRGMSLF
jgi:septum formation protein